MTKWTRQHSVRVSSERRSREQGGHDDLLRLPVEGASAAQNRFAANQLID
jgi:hypothetical protein